MTELTGWNLDDMGGSKGSNNFTRFPEGITRIRVLSKTPFMRWTHWLPSFQRKVTCPGFDCPFCKIQKAEKAQGVKSPKYPSVRNFSLMIYNHDKLQVEILEEGVTMFEELKDGIADAITDNPGTNIHSFVFRIRKKIGSTGKASWKVDVEEISELNDAEKEAMKDLLVLGEYFTVPTNDQAHQLLGAPQGDKDAMKKLYNSIMGYDKKDENEEDAGVAFEVAED